MNIDLSPEEIEVLKKLIHHELEGINPEIHHTGKASLRDELKQYRAVLQKLHERLEQSRP